MIANQSSTNGQANGLNHRNRGQRPRNTPPSVFRLSGRSKNPRLPGRKLERLKKYCSRSAASGGRPQGLLVFLARLSEGACPQRPVTERKRSQNPKEPLSSFLHPNGYRIFENALRQVKAAYGSLKQAIFRKKFFSILDPSTSQLGPSARVAVTQSLKITNPYSPHFFRSSLVKASSTKLSLVKHF